LVRGKSLRAIVANPRQVSGDDAAISNIYKCMKTEVRLVISRAHILFTSVAIVSVGAALWLAPSSAAQNSGFRNAPASAAEMKNPYKSASAVAAGKKLYALNCAQCHGSNLQGIGPAPALDRAPAKDAKPGELFWFITKGKLESGMPSWANLSQQQRWQIVTFLESQGTTKAEVK
jgi:mono/diheme cytochrome c family protein